MYDGCAHPMEPSQDCHWGRGLNPGDWLRGPCLAVVTSLSSLPYTVAPGALCPLLSIPCCPAQGLLQQLPAKLSCILWRDGSSQIRLSQKPRCVRSRQVLARLCGWLVHSGLFLKISHGLAATWQWVALTARMISLGAGAEAPTGPLRGSSCLPASLIPCW